MSREHIFVRKRRIGGKHNFMQAVRTLLLLTCYYVNKYLIKRISMVVLTSIIPKKRM